MNSGAVETPVFGREQRRFGATVVGDFGEALVGADVGDVADSHGALDLRVVFVHEGHGLVAADRQ